MALGCKERERGSLSSCSEDILLECRGWSCCPRVNQCFDSNCDDWALATMINACGEGRNNERNLNHALRYILLRPDSRKMMAENKGTLEVVVRMIVPMNNWFG